MCAQRESSTRYDGYRRNKTDGRTEGHVSKHEYQLLKEKIENARVRGRFENVICQTNDVGRGTVELHRTGGANREE